MTTELYTADQFLQTSGNDTMKEKEYDYNYEESVNTFLWDELLPPIIVYTISFFLGFIGNALIIYTVLRFRKMQTTTNLFLASLATADLLIILFCIPVKTIKIFSHTWTMGWFLCKAVHYVQYVSVFCSVLNMTAMSLERYNAIVYPLRSQYMQTPQRAKKIIILIWMSSFMLAMPVCFMQIHTRVGIFVEAYWCHIKSDNKNIRKIYEMYMLTAILLIPASIMTYAYGCVAIKLSYFNCRRPSRKSTERSFSLRSFTKENNANSNGAYRSISINRPAAEREKKQIICMLVMVVVLFVFCWAPLLLLNVMNAWEFAPGHSPEKFHKHISNTVHLLAYANSCLNPLLYGFLSKSFRNSFRAALCRCQNNENYRNTLYTSATERSTRYTSVNERSTKYTSVSARSTQYIPMTELNRH